MLANLYDFKKELSRQGIFFCFCGSFSQDLLVEIGNTLKQKMRLEEANYTTTLNVFSIFVEQVQNIIHHSAERTCLSKSEEVTRNGIIIVGYEEKNYYILCGNFINNNDVSELHAKLTKLKYMTKDELKRYYKEQRRKNVPEKSKGAGLGFIELARKAIKPIEFDFQQIDEKFSFFSLKITV